MPCTRTTDVVVCPAQFSRNVCMCVKVFFPKKMREKQNTSSTPVSVVVISVSPTIRVRD